MGKVNKDLNRDLPIFISFHRVEQWIQIFVFDSTLLVYFKNV